MIIPAGWEFDSIHGIVLVVMLGGGVFPSLVNFSSVSNELKRCGVKAKQ